MPSISLAAEWIDVGGTQYNAGTAAGDGAGKKQLFYLA